MLCISQLLQKYDPNFKKWSGPNSPRAEKIDQLMAFMGEDRRKDEEKDREYVDRVRVRFKYWLGRTRHLSPGGIFMLIKQAKDGRNPQSLFNYLLKKSHEEWKKSHINQKNASVVVKQQPTSSDSTTERPTLFD